MAGVKMLEMQIGIIERFGKFRFREPAQGAYGSDPQIALTVGQQMAIRIGEGVSEFFCLPKNFFNLPSPGS